MADGPADHAVRIVVEYSAECLVSPLFRKVWVLLPAQVRTVAELITYLVDAYVPADVRSSAGVLLEIGGIPVAPRQDIAIIRDSDVVRVTLHPQVLAIEGPTQPLAIEGPDDVVGKDQQKRKKKKKREASATRAADGAEDPFLNGGSNNVAEVKEAKEKKKRAGSRSGAGGSVEKQDGSKEGLEEGLEVGLEGGLELALGQVLKGVLEEGLGGETETPGLEEGKKKRKKRRVEEGRVSEKPCGVSVEHARVDEKPVEELAVETHKRTKGSKRKAGRKDENAELSAKVKIDVAVDDVARDDVAGDDVAERGLDRPRKKRRKESSRANGLQQEAGVLEQLGGAENAAEAENEAAVQPMVLVQKCGNQGMDATDMGVQDLGLVEAGKETVLPVEGTVGSGTEAARKEESSTESESESADEAPKREKRTPSRSARRKATKRRYARLAREAAAAEGAENVTSDRMVPRALQPAAPALTPKQKAPPSAVENMAVVSVEPVTTQHVHFSDSDDERGARAARNSRQPPIILNVGRGATGLPLSKERGKEWGLQKGRKKDKYREQRGGENGWAEVPPPEGNPTRSQNPAAETEQRKKNRFSGGEIGREKEPPSERVTGYEGRNGDWGGRIGTEIDPPVDRGTVRDVVGENEGRGQLERGKTEAEYEQLPGLERTPQVADVLAYRLVELTSSWTPQISEYREGRVVSYDAATGTIGMAWWPPHNLRARKQAAAQLEGGEAEGSPEAEPAFAPPYDEDGNLEIELSSLMGVKLVQASDVTLAQLPEAPPFPATPATNPAPELSPSSVLTMGDGPGYEEKEKRKQTEKKGAEERETDGREDNEKGGNVGTGLDFDKDAVLYGIGTGGTKELEEGEIEKALRGRLDAAGPAAADVSMEEAEHSVPVAEHGVRAMEHSVWAADGSNTSAVAAAVYPDPGVEGTSNGDAKAAVDAPQIEQSQSEPLDEQQQEAEGHVAQSGATLIDSRQGKVEAGAGNGPSETAQTAGKNVGAGFEGLGGARGLEGTQGLGGTRGLAPRPVAWQAWESVAQLLAKRRAEIAEEARLREELRKKEKEERAQLEQLERGEAELEVGREGEEESGALEEKIEVGAEEVGTARTEKKGRGIGETLEGGGQEGKGGQRKGELEVGRKEEGGESQGAEELEKGGFAAEAVQQRNGDEGIKTPRGWKAKKENQRLERQGRALDGNLAVGETERHGISNGADIATEIPGPEKEGPLSESGAARTRDLTSAIIAQAHKIGAGTFSVDGGAQRKGGAEGSHVSPGRNGERNEGLKTGHVSLEVNGELKQQTESSHVPSAGLLPDVSKEDARKATPKKEASGTGDGWRAFTKPRGPRLGALGPTLAYLRAQKNQLS